MARWVAFVAVALVGWIGSDRVLAHGQFEQFPIGAKRLKVDTRKAPARHKLLFSSTHEPAISPDHDPAVEGSAVLVRWTGQSGVGAGRSALIELDPGSWRGLGNPAGSKGYRYSNRTMSRGGIKTVLFRPGSSGGKLKIVARGENWPWELNGPHDSVWVHFRVADDWYCAEFGGNVGRNEAGFFSAKKASPPTECPAATCGNGIVEIPELCDDGNLEEDDGCNNDCTTGECIGVVYDSTFDAIQAEIFDSPTYGCNQGLCHGTAPGQGFLVLSAGNAYANLVGVPSSISPANDRVVPGNIGSSVLHDKLQAGTNAVLPTFGGSAMPLGGATVLTADHLEALELWIQGGAPEDLVVAGTSERLSSCLPEPDPPVIPPLEPPGAEVGAQFRLADWPLAKQSEREICISTYYDLTQTNLVPDWAKLPCSLGAANNPSGECFVFHRQLLAQDPKSHHSIIHIYKGSESTAHAGWGTWTYKFPDPNAHPLQGQVCDPLAVDPNTGQNVHCSGQPVDAPGCVGYGPPDSAIFFAGGFLVSQQTYFDLEYADVAYDLLPMAGIMVYNSHAFNTTLKDSTMSQYLNMYFADPNDRPFPITQIFDISNIFLPDVPPFETKQYCANYVIPPNANLFHLTTHTHQRGVNFRVWEPPNTPCSAGACPEGDPGQLIYTSTHYLDPIQLYFDPPILYTGGTNARTFRYCSLYDNGSMPTSPPVKLQSTSPTSSLPFIPGGPCPDSTVACVDGPRKGELCNGNDSFCDSSPGQGDGNCDACPVTGGVTTEDEMFIPLGTFY